MADTGHPPAAQATAPFIEERIRISSGDHDLEGMLAYACTSTPTFAAAIAGPHPLLGGDLQNNVVAALRRSVACCGGVAIAYNYSGVGESNGGPKDWPAVVAAFWETGCFDEERAWVDDMHAAMNKLNDLCNVPTVLIGYSFGCWPCARCLNDARVSAAVLISPNPTRQDLGGVHDTSLPIGVIHSDNDFTCSTEDVCDWFSRIAPPKSIVEISAGEHFFRGCEDEVCHAVTSFIRKNRLAGGDIR